MYPFSVFKHCACQSSYFQPNKLTFLRSAINTLSIVLPDYQILKIRLEFLLLPSTEFKYLKASPF